MKTHCPSRLRGPIVRGTSRASEKSPGNVNRKSDTIRTQLVDRVRAEIAAGNYDTPDRLAAAIDIFLKRSRLD